MIEITQEEFETKIRDVIAGKVSRSKLAKELKTDTRTLNNKIQELATCNRELYLSFIKKYPYKQKERDDIDYEALIIEITKNSMTSIDAARKYRVGVRTIQRRVNEIEKENPYLIEIYKEVKNNNKHGIKNSLELEEKIDQLVPRAVKVSEINETRKQQLEEIEEQFNKRCEYLGKEESARTMGMTLNRTHKLLNELNRIRTEEMHKKELKDEKANFRKYLKSISSTTVNNKESTNKSNTLEKNNTPIIEIEGEEK